MVSHLLKLLYKTNSDTVFELIFLDLYFSKSCESSTANTSDSEVNVLVVQQF